MKIDKIQSDVEIYNLNMNSENNEWLWDFGVFTLVGNKDYPMSSVKNMIPFSAILNELDVSEINKKEPYEKRKIDMYIGDYVIYVETEFENSTHIISPNNILYNIIESSAYLNESKYVIVQENSKYKNKKEIYNKNKLKDWIPVLEII